jgi:hypothetical protein
MAAYLPSTAADGIPEVQETNIPGLLAFAEGSKRRQVMYPK